MHAGGPRRAELDAAGVAVAEAGGDQAALTRLLEGADVVHVFRSGGREPLLPAAFRRAGARALVETNVFGQVDPSPDEALFACHLFVSRMCALRYRGRTGLDGPDFHRRHRVLPWPVELGRLRGLAPEPREARRRLGLDPERPTVVRVGRADDRKWRDLLVDFVPHLLELVPDAQVALVGATPRRLRRLSRHGVLRSVALLPETADEERLATYYAAADVGVTAAEIGESQSVVIEESLALGVPVVTSPTPWVDDAQVEQVDHGENGYLAEHPRPFAEAVAALLLDPELRGRFAASARAKAERELDATVLTRRLEGLYEAVAAGEPAPQPWQPAPEEIDGFAAEYARRSASTFRPLTGRERAEVRAARLRERALWAARAAGRLDRERAALVVSMLAANARGLAQRRAAD